MYLTFPFLLTLIAITPPNLGIVIPPSNPFSISIKEHGGLVMPPEDDEPICAELTEILITHNSVSRTASCMHPDFSSAWKTLYQRQRLLTASEIPVVLTALNSFLAAGLSSEKTPQTSVQDDWTIDITISFSGQSTSLTAPRHSPYFTPVGLDSIETLIATSKSDWSLRK